MVDDVRWEAFSRKRDAIAQEQARLRGFRVRPRDLADGDAVRVLGQPIEREYTLAELLRRPNVSYRLLMSLPSVGEALEDPIAAQQVEIQAKYEGYIGRQCLEVERHSAQEGTALPVGIDYREVAGLSAEVQQKLNRHRPETIGQASRVSGITPAAIALLLVHLKKGSGALKKSA